MAMGHFGPWRSAWTCWALLLAAVEVSALIVKEPVPGRTEHLVGQQGPTPTEGQESQECGYLLLPETVQLRTTWSGPLGRSGLWKTPSGGTLATYEQSFFRWQPQKVSFYRGAKLLFRTEVDGLDMNQTLVPGDVLQRVGLLDCLQSPLFFFDVRNATTPSGVVRFEYDVYDGKGEFVAIGRYNTSYFYPDQLVFRDQQAQPIAVAEAPEIQPKPLEWVVPPKRTPGQEVGVSPWEVKFYGASSSKSDFILAQFRWVIVAIVQDHALRVADTPTSTSRSRAWPSAAETASGAYKALLVLVLPLLLFIACSGVSGVLLELLLPTTKRAKESTSDDPFLLQQDGSMSTSRDTGRDQTTARSAAGPRTSETNITLPPGALASAGFQQPGQW